MLINKNFKIIFLGFLLICSFLDAKTQTITVNVQDQPLTEVFQELKENYGIQFSFNNKLLEECQVSKSATYNSAKEAISDLIKGHDFTYEISNDVFIILPALKSKPHYYSFSGAIRDKINKEPLPASTILFEKSGISTDINGNFCFKSRHNKIKIHASYVGYYKLDTLLSAGHYHSLNLTPSVIGLQEVVVYKDGQVEDMHVGQNAGMIKVNHKLASFLPGNVDNTIYNLLRLQAGIMAAGEQTQDYSIWGSYKGQTLVLYDNIPLFNISSFNDNISVINPLIVKDIEIIKGGYNVGFSNRVGGVVNISGKNGNFEHFVDHFNINNQTFNGFINIPIANNFALQSSFRQSFKNGINVRNQNLSKERITPNYNFYDINVKVSGKLNNSDNFYVSLISGHDDMDYSFIQEKDRLNILFISEEEQKRNQFGGAFYYNKNWKYLGSSNFTTSFSKLNSTIDNSLQIKSIDDYYNYYTLNTISEISSKVDHFFPAKGINNISTGINYTYNTSTFKQDRNDRNIKDNFIESRRIGAYIKNNIYISNKINIHPGVRVDYSIDDNLPYFQPRIDANIIPFINWKINLAWGIYNQFVSENAVLDLDENYLYVWNVCDNRSIKIPHSQHFVTGFSFDKNNIQLSVEGFYKITEQMSRFLRDYGRNKIDYSEGDSKNMGLDFYFKTKIKKHKFWVAYTLSRSTERFDYFKNKQYELALHNQTHEIKTAAIFNLSPFFVSMNYVYGSGLEFTRKITLDNEPYPYNRFDVAVLYKFDFQKIKLESGISIINLFNIKNIRYNGFTSLPGGKRIYTNALPFSPLFNLRMSF